SVRFFIILPASLISFHRNADQFLTELRITDSQSRRLLGDQAGGGHARKGIGLQTVEPAVLTHEKIQAAVPADSQSLRSPQGGFLHFLCFLLRQRRRAGLHRTSRSVL